MTCRRVALHAWPLALLPFAGCIEDRLSVDITTRILADGACSRRVEYRLERVDTDRGDARLPIDPADDPLRRLHRFPTDEIWNIRDEAGPEVHTVVLEANLPSPDAVEGDYLRQRTPRSPPARNLVSFILETDATGGTYEYAETFLDPASPLAGARALAQIAQKKDDEFATRLLRALDRKDAALRRSDVKRAYREDLVAPLATAVAALASRPVFGPRERASLEALVDGLDPAQAKLLQSLLLLSPGANAEALEKATDAVLEEIGNDIGAEFETTGLPPPVDLSEHRSRIHFRATLIMPAPILRANTCAQGDTATWEFDQDDLYGRGFEMWARAASR